MFTEGSKETTLAETSATICASPSSGVKRLVNNIHLDNPDSIPHTVSVFKVTSSGTKRLFRVNIASNSFFTFSKLIILDATDESLTALMGEANVSESVTADVPFGDAS